VPHPARWHAREGVPPQARTTAGVRDRREGGSSGRTSRRKLSRLALYVARARSPAQRQRALPVTRWQNQWQPNQGVRAANAFGRDD
jgi:hypothetical protein